MKSKLWNGFKLFCVGFFLFSVAFNILYWGPVLFMGLTLGAGWKD